MAYNPYIVVPLATWAVSQISKFAVAAFRGKVDFRYLYSSGGMPSVHSAVVMSLATTALLVDGASSHLFGFTVVFAAVVMYDSIGVRRSVGEQAVAVNMVIESLERNKVRLDQPGTRFREILGHQPREVLVGAAVGIGLGTLFNYNHLGSFGTFLQTVPSRHELIAYFAVALLLIVGGAVASLVLRQIYRKSKIMRKLSKRILVATQTVGWLLLVTCALVYENASYFAWRLWPDAILAVGLVWAVWLATASYKTVPATLANEANQARKQKWLNWGQNKRKSRRA